MADETASTRRIRRDPKLGRMTVSLPKEIVERLPQEAEVEFALPSGDRRARSDGET